MLNALAGAGRLRFDQPAEPLVQQPAGMVVAYHPEVRRVGEQVLAAGGNAFDAFVAAVAAENVVAEGASSLAGPLAALLYIAAEDRVTYLDATFNDPLDPEGAWSPEESAAGRAILVPGAPAGLAELAARYGRLPFADLLAPAIMLAEGGFPANRLMAACIAERVAVLRASDYGAGTYLRRGRPLRPGNLVQQPEVGAFLRGLAAEGADYVYRGEWGGQFLEAVQATDGRLGVGDLAAYSVEWHEPWLASYRDHLIHSCSGRSFGGLWVLLALQVLQAAGPRPDGRPSHPPADLAGLVAIARRVWAEGDLFDPAALETRPAMEQLLARDHAHVLLAQLMDAPTSSKAVSGPHSYQIIVHDRDGNIANGTTTLQSDPWADGLFVQGVPLTSAGRLPFGTSPGRRRISPFSLHIVRRGEQPWLAVGTISNSVVEAAFQVLINLIDHGSSLEDAVMLPRFGTFPPVAKSGAVMADVTRNWVDPRITRDTLRVLKARGVEPARRRPVDTGLGAVLRVENGMAEGMVLPLPYLTDPFGTTPR
ncbi:MAG: hypothetical protein JWR00_4189 [Rubritepida sp.]|nr:hypothetical protein [Rubritepida sp.]